MNKETERLNEFILKSLGDDILACLKRTDVNEVYVNEDYVVRLDTNTGKEETNIIVDMPKVKAICEALAGYNRQIINEDKPILGVELNTLQLRAQLIYPPISRRPIFFLRKKPQEIYTLDSYLERGTISQEYYDFLIDAIAKRKNVVLIGATGSGKTTFLNAILHKIAEIHPEHRILVLEDTPELQCSSKDVQHLITSGNRENKITMQDLVFASMRLSPHRIIIGEVRDESCYAALKAWNTGHAGGFCTIHANSTVDALSRLELLANESDQVNNTDDVRQLIGSTVDVIISIQKKVSPTGTYRSVEDIIAVDEYSTAKKEYIYHHI